MQTHKKQSAFAQSEKMRNAEKTQMGLRLRKENAKKKNSFLIFAANSRHSRRAVAALHFSFSFSSQ